MTKKRCALFWFRRDLRLEDNHGLFAALQGDDPVLPIFIFDTHILQRLPKDDARVTFIYDRVSQLQKTCREQGSDLLMLHGKPEEVFPTVLETYDVSKVYTNHDYEPDARVRDQKIATLLKGKNIALCTFKDQVLFEKGEILKKDGTPYTVYTPYAKQWRVRLEDEGIPAYPSQKHLNNLLSIGSLSAAISLKDLGFERSDIDIPGSDVDVELLEEYAQHRDFPAEQGTSRLGLHLRFGTISVRELAAIAKEQNSTFLGELIWREFFMQILWHFPQVTTKSFHEKYDKISWINDKKQFAAWKEGKTGYPMIDAGMRELNTTGFMHNRVRMVVASFLCKHLLIDWRWGEAYFAEKLLDYELSANNGNWQWCAGTGCDAAPYFRVFNPELQQKKFDPDGKYLKKWVPEYGTEEYPKPMVEHAFARKRALETYKSAINS